MAREWIDVSEAARLLGYNTDYFRRVYCNPQSPLLVIRIWQGNNGGRRTMVLRASVEKLIERQVIRPHG
jgi:hypothetical protein